MFKSKFGALMLGVLMCASFGTSKAAQNFDPVVVLAGGAASGWGLAQIYHKMEAKQIHMLVKAPVMVAMAVAAYGIRTQLVKAPRGGTADALGLLGAIGTFFYTV